MSRFDSSFWQCVHLVLCFAIHSATVTLYASSVGKDRIVFFAILFSALLAVYDRSLLYTAYRHAFCNVLRVTKWLSSFSSATSSIFKTLVEDFTSDHWGGEPILILLQDSSGTSYNFRWKPCFMSHAYFRGCTEPKFWPKIDESYFFYKQHSFCFQCSKISTFACPQRRGVQRNSEPA